MADYRVYILHCGDGSYYTGIATDVDRRMAAHRAGKGARYLRGRGPLELKFSAPAGDRSAAQKIECRIKRLTRAGKERLIAAGDNWREFLQEPSAASP